MKVCLSVVALALALSALTGDAAAAETTVRSGVFHGGPHEPGDTASGGVRLVRLDSGRYELRLGDDFSTTNGPDLFIYLSAAENPKDDAIVAQSAFVNAGKLKSTKGRQKYLLPAAFEPKRFTSVAVWCKEFGVLFGAAALVSK